MVKFRDTRQGSQELVKALGGLTPEALLTNSHDGASTYNLMLGIYRFICGNGLIIGEHLIPPVKIAHRGGANAADAVIEATYSVIDETPKMLGSIERFQRLQLDAPEQRAFATAALGLRYEDEQAPITVEQVLAPRRREDAEPTLWATFNRVQESLVAGGNSYRAESGRRQRVRPVQGISENARLNKALWTLAEEMAKLKG